MVDYDLSGYGDVQFHTTTECSVQTTPTQMSHMFVDLYLIGVQVVYDVARLVQYRNHFSFSSRSRSQGHVMHLTAVG